MKLANLREHEKRVNAWALNHCREDYDAFLTRQIEALHVDLQGLALKLEFADTRELNLNDLVNDSETIWAALAFIDCFIDD